VIIEDEA